MIDCFIIENKGLIAVVKIHGEGFYAELEYFKSVIDPKDREYDEERKAWYIKRPKHYSIVPFIHSALEDHRRQLRFL